MDVLALSGLNCTQSCSSLLQSKKPSQFWKLPRYLKYLITFRERLARIKPRPETCANDYKLIETEERSLVNQLLDADKQGFAIQAEFLHGMAQILLRGGLHDSAATLGCRLGIYLHQTSF